MSQSKLCRMLLLSLFSRVRLRATPQTAAHQAPPSLGFSRQEHRSGLPFPSPTHESEEWKWSRSVMSNSLWPHGLQHARPPCPLLTPRVYSNACPLSQWCHPVVSASPPTSRCWNHTLIFFFFNLSKFSSFWTLIWIYGKKKWRDSIPRS